MDIERRQAQHNAVQTSVNNNSVGAETLLSGAAALATGQFKGLSNEETLAAISSAAREKNRRSGIDDRNIVQRAIEQLDKTLVDAEGNSLSTVDNQQGYSTIETYGKRGRAKYDDDFTDEDIAQGRTDIEEGFRTEAGERYMPETGSYRSEGEVYDPQPREERFSWTPKPNRKGSKTYTYKDRVRPQEASGSAVNAVASSLVGKEGVERKGTIPIGTTADSAPLSVYDSRTGEGTGPAVDALRRVQSGTTTSRFTPEELAARRARVFGTSAPEVVTESDREAVKKRIIQSTDPRAARQAERKAVQQMIIADAATRDPERVQLVQAAAAAGADDMLLYNRMPGQNTTEDIVDPGIAGRPEAVLRQRGKSGEIYYTDQPITGRAEDAVPILERSDDIDVIMRGSPNKPDSAQMQNAPRVVEAKGLRTEKGITSFIEGLGRPSGQSAAEWLMANKPGADSSGNCQEPDITLARTNIANKLRKISGIDAEMLPPEINSVEDLAQAQILVEQARRKKNQSLFIKQGSEQVPAPEGDVRGLMHALKMSGPEQTNLANAIAAQTLAQTTPASTKAKIIGGVNPNDTGVDAGLAKVPANSTIRGEGGKRTNIRALLSQLEGKDAQQPFIGAVEGETDAGPRARSRFVGPGIDSGRGIASNLRRQAISRLKPGQKLDKERLASNIKKAVGLSEDEAVRRVNAAAKADSPGFAPTRVAMDAAFSAEAQRRRNESGAADNPFTITGRAPSSRLSDRRGELVSLRKPSTQYEPSTKYHDSTSSEYDVATRMSELSGGPTASSAPEREPGGALATIAQERTNRKEASDNRAKSFADRRKEIGDRIRAEFGTRRGKYGAAALGAGLAAAGINDAVNREEGLIRY